MVSRINVPTGIDVVEDSAQRGKVRMDVGKECVPHQARAFVAEVSRRAMTTAESGQAR